MSADAAAGPSRPLATATLFNLSRDCLDSVTSFFTLRDVAMFEAAFLVARDAISQVGMLHGLDEREFRARKTVILNPTVGISAIYSNKKGTLRDFLFHPRASRATLIAADYFYPDDLIAAYESTQFLLDIKCRANSEMQKILYERAQNFDRKDRLPCTVISLLCRHKYPGWVVKEIFSRLTIDVSHMRMAIHNPQSFYLPTGEETYFYTNHQIGEKEVLTLGERDMLIFLLSLEKPLRIPPRLHHSLSCFMALSPHSQTVKNLFIKMVRPNEPQNKCCTIS